MGSVCAWVCECVCGVCVCWGVGVCVVCVGCGSLRWHNRRSELVLIHTSTTPSGQMFGQLQSLPHPLSQVRSLSGGAHHQGLLGTQRNQRAYPRGESCL